MENGHNEEHFNKRKVNAKMDSDSEDEVVAEYDVVVCDNVQNADLFSVQFPKRRQKIFEADINPRMRYKKNVRLMEMRFLANMNSNSFEKSKMEKCKSESPVKSPIKNEAESFVNDEIYEGRACQVEACYQHSVGIIRNKTLYINSVCGIFNMKRIIKGRVGLLKTEDDDVIMDSDSDVPSSSKQLRVKFSRPETERQKKRREASALYRERMIASDHWLNINMYLKSDPRAVSKIDRTIPNKPLFMDNTYSLSLDMRGLALSSIICANTEQLDPTQENQIMSYQRIKALPLHQQVRAHVMKAYVVSMQDIERVVEGISRQDLITSLKECAHLLKGVWVIRSEYLFHKLPPAHCNVPGKIDETRSTLWRNARDLVLCLLSANQRVNRLTLSRCFKLDPVDAEEILCTVGRKNQRNWELRIQEDKEFLNDPDNTALVLEERRFWNSRWRELKSQITV